MSDKANKFDTSMIRELAAVLRDADLTEIEVEHQEFRIRVMRTPPQAAQVVTYAAQPTYSAAPPAPAAAPVAAASVASPVSADHPGAVKSPMVGTAYRSAEPGAKPFVEVGDMVAEGDTLFLVEAMKTFNPVTAPRAGKVVSIAIADSQPVEYGELLLVLE
jgi:acetyl-CoA carboxylase biotin carboxyl carrier protein